MGTNTDCHPKGFPWPELRLSQETYIDPVLTEEIIKFHISAADTVGVPSGHALAVNLVCPCNPCCHTRLRKGQRFWGDNVRWPEVWVGTVAKILRVSSTHASRWRTSRISEVSSMGDWLGWGGKPGHWLWYAKNLGFAVSLDSLWFLLREFPWHWA